MTWEELCEKAKEMGYIVTCNGYCLMSNDNKIYNHTMHYCKDGVITSEHFEKHVFVADHRTPEQMLAIMEALK